MTTDALPGLSLQVVPPPAEPDVLRTDVACVLGRTLRGPVGVPVRVGSRPEYEAWFGPVGPGPATPLAVRGFFENGGRTIWVVRVSGSAGTADAVWTPGDPLPPGLDHARYLVQATSPGAWANDIRVGITYQASSLAGPPAIRVRVTAPGESAETFGPVPPAQLAPAVAASRLVRLLPLGDPVPAAGAAGAQVRRWDLVLGNPACRSPQGRGSEDSPSAADYRRAVQVAAELPEPALLAAPDLTDDLGTGAVPTLADLVATVHPLQDRLVVLDAPAATTPVSAAGPAGPSADGILTWVAGLRAAVRELAGDDRPLDCAALYYPRLRLRPLPEGTDETPVTVPSAGHVLGVVARLDAERGAYQTPANAVLLEALDLDPVLPVPQQVRLFEAGVNLLRCSPGRGLQVWGGRTLSADPAARYVAHRRLLHLLVRAIRRVAQPLVFEVNGPQLRLTLVRGITSVLLSAFHAGALAGERPEQAFGIVCDERNNPPTAPPELVVCDVEVAPATPMEFIRIRVVLGAEQGLEVLES